MKRATVLKHASFEGLGRLESLLVSRGYTLDLRELHRGDAVPRSLPPGDVLVVMGGPMGVADAERPEYSFLRRELELLSRCIEDDAPVLGVCLGAQLLAFAAGAAVHPMVRGDGERCYEVGWAKVRFLPQGDADPVLRGVPTEAQVVHWHGDMFELPPRARLLSSTALCPNQGFQLGSRLFGLQFHCEVSAEDVDEFLRADAAFVQRVGGLGAEERIRLDTQRYIASLAEVGDRLLGNMLRVMTSERLV